MASDNKGKGGKGDTLKALQQELKTTRARLNDREKTIKSLEQDKKNMKSTIDSLESWKKKINAKMAKEQKIRTGAVSEKQEMTAFLEKTQRAIAARLGLIGIDFRKCNNIREALDAAVNAINHLAAQLDEKEAELKSLKEEMDLLKKRLAELEAKLANLQATCEKQNETISNQNQEIENQKKEIKKLEKENKSKEKEIERLMAELSKLKEAHTSYKDDTGTQLEQMRARISELEANEENNLHEIDELKKLVEKLRGEIENLTKELESRVNSLSELEKGMEIKNNELLEKDSRIASLEERVKELEEQLFKLLNKPMEDKETNTILTGDINHQLTDYPRLLKSIVELRNILSAKNDLIAKLQEENRELLLELGILMKKLVAFHPCQTNHSSSVTCLAAHPNKYVFASGSDDKTVRLWKVDPDSKSNSKKIMVYKYGMIDSKVSCVAWNYDGSLLACGTAYRDSPDGYVVIWCMKQIDSENDKSKSKKNSNETGNHYYDLANEKYNAIFAIRSRPTVRFGKVNAISFSHSSNTKHGREDRYIYCGDITGSIWVFDLEKEFKIAGSGLVGVIQSHKDIIYDIAVTLDGRFLYSVSHDQTMAVFELTKDLGGDLAVKSITHSKHDNDDNSSNNSNNSKRSSKALKKSKSVRNSKLSSRASSTRSIGVGTPTSVGGNPSSALAAAAAGNGKGGKSGKSHHEQEDSTSLKYSLSEILADESIAQIAHYGGVMIAQNDKYPFWKVCVSDNGQFVICASRKIKILVINGNPYQSKEKSISEGSKVSDSDLDHIKSLRIRNGKLVICRKKTDRVKLFDVESGKECKKIQFKKPVQAVEFLGDNGHMVVCCQKVEGLVQPPVMKLVKYSNEIRQIEKEEDVDKNLLLLNMNPSMGNSIGNSMDFDAQSPPITISTAAAGAAAGNDDEKDSQ